MHATKKSWSMSSSLRKFPWGEIFLHPIGFVGGVQYIWTLLVPLIAGGGCINRVHERLRSLPIVLTLICLTLIISTSAVVFKRLENFFCCTRDMRGTDRSVLLSGEIFRFDSEPYLSRRFRSPLTGAPIKSVSFCSPYFTGRSMKEVIHTVCFDQ